MGSQMSQCWQNCDRVIASQAILDWFRLDHLGFFNRFITMDETWIHIRIWSRDQRTDQGMETLAPRVQRRSRHRYQARCWRDFRDRDGIVLVDYLEKGAAIMAKYCVALLYKLKQLRALRTSRQVFERNLVSSRQFCSSQGGRYAPQIGSASLSNSETPGLLTWFGPFGLLALS
jgi:hypothetical protein